MGGEQTFRGHFSLEAYCGPQFAGSHSDLAVQELTQFSALQKSGPMPQMPLWLQHPIAHGLSAEQV